jgi:predicted Na+-dependent transporter
MEDHQRQHHAADVLAGEDDVGHRVTMLVVDVVLLAIVLTVTTVASRRLGFSREDEITIGRRRGRPPAGSSRDRRCW